jgi:hypothetical protein
MSKENYGYGTWSASYWFIGPEQGGSRSDSEKQLRADTWQNLGSLSLNDSRIFHRNIRQPHWHEEPVSIQSTWGRLILAVLKFKGEQVTDDKRKEYQQNEWGSDSGETCVIELSGLAAPSLREKTSEHARLDSESLAHRIEFILDKIRREHHTPKFIVLYGKTSLSCKRIWEALCQLSQPISDSSLDFAEFRKLNQTVIARIRHPIRSSNKIWIELGSELRRIIESS